MVIAKVIMMSEAYNSFVTVASIKSAKKGKRNKTASRVSVFITEGVSIA